MIRYGPAGNSQSFHDLGYKGTKDLVPYCLRMGLTAFEYQCGRGVRIGEAAAAELGRQAAEADIALSLHAPYYISLSGVDEEKRLGSLRYILESARAVRWMGGRRIVIHAGSAGKIPREQALALARDTMTRAIRMLDEEGLGEVILCPETMGKLGQLGNLEEVLTLCKLDERMIPCIDFGHLNARSYGGIRTRADYAAILDAIENALGYERLCHLHVHFSKIQYTIPGGEKTHLTFEDTEYGPEFPPLAAEIVRRKLEPVLICESDGTQAEDAGRMKATIETIEREESQHGES